MSDQKSVLVTFILIENIWPYTLNATDDDDFSVSLGPCVLDIGDPCTPDKILFYLYTSESKENAVNITVKDIAIPPGYDVNADTKVLIHGYAGNVGFKGMVAIRRDWGALVRLPCYPTAVFNTVQAGRCTALLLSNIASLQKGDVGDFHVLGFSLGAHVASFASNNFEKLHGKKLRRITGLDPALPFFASLSNSWKLDQQDADFVDVIHTNSGVFGKIENTGHVDFYVNHGFLQPACSQADNVPLCSHNMSLVYFGESITVGKSNGFWGIRCSGLIDGLVGSCQNSSDDLALMGEYCATNTRGVYFVRTRDRPPYGLGKPV
ncbi:UNVERIFIED_CONTAM: hypothetical protein PYX00_009033 [Menopon gallinae]|uniref:Lipase domain-containing protein n=1 Tax=Menopon gallinae TaxID=328185 RepID=A0AAW2H9Q8_9NEOP